MPAAPLVEYPHPVPVTLALTLPVTVALSVAVPLALDQPVRESHRRGESLAHRVSSGERQQQPREDGLTVSLAARPAFAIAIRAAVRDIRNHGPSRGIHGHGHRRRGPRRLRRQQQQPEPELRRQQQLEFHSGHEQQR